MKKKGRLLLQFILILSLALSNPAGRCIFTVPVRADEKDRKEDAEKTEKEEKEEQKKAEEKDKAGKQPEAKKEEKKQAAVFTVTFDANGHGTAPAKVSVNAGEKVKNPGKLTADGFSFTGWFKDSAGKTKWDFDKDTVSADTKLFAGWKEAAEKKETKKEEKQEPEAEPEPEVKQEPEAEPEPEVKQEPEAEPEPEPEVKQEPEAKPEPEVKQEPEAEPEPEVKQEPEAEPEPEVKQEPEAEPEPEVKQEPEAEPEPEAEQEPGAEPEETPEVPAPARKKTMKASGPAKEAVPGEDVPAGEEEPAENVPAGEQEAPGTVALEPANAGEGEGEGEGKGEGQAEEKKKQTLTVAQEGTVFGNALPDPVFTKPEGSGEPALSYSGTLRDGSAYGPNGIAPTAAGKYTITVTCETGTEVYSGSADFTIEPKDIKGAEVTLGESLTYTGQSLTQKVTAVKLDGTDITAACEAEGNVVTDAGTYTLTVTALETGNYTGSVTADFKVAKAVPEIGSVTAGTVKDNLKISAAKLKRSNTKVPGSLALKEKALKYGTNTYHWTFTPEDETNYEKTSGTLEIRVTGHTWGETVYKWSSDLSTVTARRVCENDASHVQTEKVKTTSKVTTEPTCTKKGVTTYTAKFKNKAFKTQKKKVRNIKALGHKWGKWTVTKKATTSAEGEKTRICEHDDSHVQKKAIPKIIAYTFSQGSGSTWRKGSTTSLGFTVKRSSDDSTTYDHFEQLKIDGYTVSGSNYSVSSGSLKIYLKPAYLEKMSVGTHIITAEFDDGSASGKFTVAKKAAARTTVKKSGSSGSTTKTSSVKTGDSSGALVWLAGMCGAALLAALVLIRRRRQP